MYSALHVTLRLWTIWTALILATALPCRSIAATGAELADALKRLSLDPDNTFRVRELVLNRGDAKFFLSEGVLAFAKPVEGQTIAAVFTTERVEAGDAELILLPPTRSERTSLAHFTQAANLNEHFSSALFFFSDDTKRELSAQLESGSLQKAPELTADLQSHWGTSLQSAGGDLVTRTVEHLLDGHDPAQGEFFAVVNGQTLGVFDVLYQPTLLEPMAVGRLAQSGQTRSASDDHKGGFQLWTAFRPRRAPPYTAEPVQVQNYRAEVKIEPDLSAAVNIEFGYRPSVAGSRVATFGLSRRLQVTSATVNAEPVEILQRLSESQDTKPAEQATRGSFLVIRGQPFDPHKTYRISLHYHGPLILKSERQYLVNERSSWFPTSGPVFTNFDLTFHSPVALKVVATGSLIKERASDGVRTAHYVTETPEHFAGFNIGEYVFHEENRKPYRVRCLADASTPARMRSIALEAADLLGSFSSRWGVLPFHDVSVSPIPANLGQGFPGLIYLSANSYLDDIQRPKELRGPAMDLFFSGVLLPHETAHQWWGNVVVPEDYRTDWLMEAMANYSALQVLERRVSPRSFEQLLNVYRADLLARKPDGTRFENAGAVVLGSRLLESYDFRTWQVIVYEKGTWIIHMLRQRLGDAQFLRLQQWIIEHYSQQPISNDQFRLAAGRFAPSGQPDRGFQNFFDAWVFGTGIPRLTLRREPAQVTLEMSGVDPDFAVDVPLYCTDGKVQTIHWVHAAGEETVLNPALRSCSLPKQQDFLYSR